MEKAFMMGFLWRGRIGSLGRAPGSSYGLVKNLDLILIRRGSWWKVEGMELTVMNPCSQRSLWLPCRVWIIGWHWAGKEASGPLLWLSKDKVTTFIQEPREDPDTTHLCLLPTHILLVLMSVEYKLLKHTFSSWISFIPKHIFMQSLSAFQQL